MAKNFTKSIGSKNLSSLIPTSEPEKEPKKEKVVTTTKNKSAAIPKESKTAKTTVTTFRINNDSLEAVKAIAFWDRKKIQDVFNEALEAYLKTIPATSLKKAQVEYKKRS